MSESMQVEYLIQGLKPSLLEKLWPLLPDPIANAESFLTHLLRYSQAFELRDSAQEIATHDQLKRKLIVTMDSRMYGQPLRANVTTPGIVTREEFIEQAADYKKMFADFKKELLASLPYAPGSMVGSKCQAVFPNPLIGLQTNRPQMETYI